MLEGNEILFVGIGKSSILWYRCALPALHLGADWIGVRGQPPNVQVLTGLVRGNTTLPRYSDYKVVIIQQPYGSAWLKQINSLRARGIKVLFEVDDYLHGVAKQKTHDFAKDFGKERLRAYELCMRACDGMICSTPYIARRYAKFNPRVYVCRNGLDINRYNLTRPSRPTVNVGFAGATGHVDALVPWVNAAIPVLKRHPNTCFVAIGMPELAAPVGKLLGDTSRALGIPFIPIEVYPSAMCLFDIALAPAADKTWYHGKSDLRWLEAGALRIPIIADRTVYPEITHSIDGFHADSPIEMAAILEELIGDGELRDRVGAAAREHIARERTAEVAAQQWFEVCSAVAGDHESMHAYHR
jgi:glycosyltransferase involved in cell wall biosynthesis